MSSSAQGSPSPHPAKVRSLWPSPGSFLGSGAGQGPALMHHGLADSARRSELRLVPRLRVAGGQLVAAAALPALGATGHVGQGVRADEISVGGRRALASRSAQEARLDTRVGVRCPATW